jgi:hypothetical protein
MWLAGITEHWTDEGKLYCCAIKDVFSNRIVGWSIDSRMKARLVVAAIEMAVARRGDTAGCILHSDRGSQFRSRKVHRDLARYGMVGSMGQVGSASDNAAPVDPQWRAGYLPGPCRNLCRPPHHRSSTHEEVAPRGEGSWTSTDIASTSRRPACTAGGAGLRSSRRWTVWGRPPP